MLTLHNLKPSKNSKKQSKRVGRGNSSGKGTYSTRGAKGQRARSGGRHGLKLRGFKQNLINIPKLRGDKSLNTPKLEVSLFILNEICNGGETVTPEFLKEKGIIKTIRYGVKILGNGILQKNITIKNCGVSASAKEQIEKLGGKVIN